MIGPLRQPGLIPWVPQAIVGPFIPRSALPGQISHISHLGDRGAFLSGFLGGAVLAPRPPCRISTGRAPRGLLCCPERPMGAQVFFPYPQPPSKLARRFLAFPFSVPASNSQAVRGAAVRAASGVTHYCFFGGGLCSWALRAHSGQRRPAWPPFLPRPLLARSQLPSGLALAPRWRSAALVVGRTG